MAESEEPLIHTCHACGTLIDISDAEPLALVHCPSCGTGQRVRGQFDHFQLQDILGAGGMGAVYRAFDQSLNRFVALKLLRKEYSADPAFVEQFQREATTTASINHPNVVKVFSAGTDHGLVYIAMELVDKGSLDDLMTLQGRVAEVQVLEVGAQIARGLDAALRRGLIHRDVKPGNILFSDAHSAKIVDFGLATLQHQAIKAGGEIWGTPYYVAPEKLDVPPLEDFRSDLYSLGATLFHALAGRPPYEADTPSMVALKHIKSQPVSLQMFAPDLSNATAFAINKALSKNASDRFQSYEELAQNLEYARNELMKRGGGKLQRKRVVVDSADEAKAMSWITFAMVAFVVVGGLGVWLMRDKFFPSSSKPKIDPLVEKNRKRLEELQPDFKIARDVIVRGEFTQAARVLEQLEAEPEVPQPLLDWISLHRGLALLFAGQEPESRKSFGLITDRGMFGRDPEETKMAMFFTEIAKPMAGDKPIEASSAKDFDKSTYQSIALLLFGLKDWHMAEYDEAAALFRQFRSITPEPNYRWILDYKQLTAPYLDDYVALQTAKDSAAKANTTDARKAAVGTLKTTKERLKLKTDFAEKIDAMIAKLEGENAKSEEAMQAAVAEKEAADTPKLAEAKSKCSPLVTQYRFEEARKIAHDLSMRSEKYKTEAQAFATHMDALASFKARLIRDFSGGYKGSITRRSGTVVPPGQISATESQLEVKAQYGKLNIPWSDVSPDSLIDAAKAFIKPELPADAVADRKWDLGLYALTMGRKAIASELTTAAASAKVEYSTARELLGKTIPGGL